MRQEEYIKIFSKVINEEKIMVDNNKIQMLIGENFKPDILLCPQDINEIVALIKMANHYQLAIYPIGSGSRFNEAFIPFQGGILLSTINLNKIVEYRPDNMSIEVEAGLTYDKLQKELAKDNNFYPVDAKNIRSTIGGQIATNSYGRKKYLYKSTRFHVLGMEFVSPQGEVIKVGGRTVKNVSGYDISQLLIGSWGNFGIITKATLKVRPLPEKNIKMQKLVNNLLALANLIKVVWKEKLSLASLTFKQIENQYLVQIELEGFADTLLLQVNHLKDKLDFQESNEEIDHIGDFNGVLALSYTDFCTGLELLSDFLEKNSVSVKLQGNITNGVLEFQGDLLENQLNSLKSKIEKLTGDFKYNGTLLTSKHKTESYLNIVRNIKQYSDPQNILVPNSKAIKG